MNDKKTLITIVVLLVVFLPMSIYGTMHRMNNKVDDKPSVEDDNPTKELVYNGYLYFYDDNGVLLGKRMCKGECAKAESVANDSEYGINYYNKGNEEAPLMLANNYVLFKDQEQTILYNLDSEKDTLTFDAIKTYNISHTSPVIITTSGGKMGVISLESMMPIISYQYDFIGIPNRVIDGILDTSRFIAKNGDNWYILESDGSYKGEEYQEPIIDFNNNYVVTKNQDELKIYDYEKNEYLTEIVKKAVYSLGDYILIISDTNNLLVYSDLNVAEIKSATLSEYSSIDFDYKTTSIDVYLDGNLNQSIDLT